MKYINKPTLPFTQPTNKFPQKATTPGSKKSAKSGNAHRLARLDILF